MLSAIKGEYRGVARFFKAYRKFWLVLLAFAVALSVISTLFLFSYFSKNADAMVNALFTVAETFEGKEGIINTETGSISAVGLFKNNILAMMLIITLGTVPFIFVPVFTLALNLIIMSVTVTAGTAIGAFSFSGAFMLIAPHGIFEIPALLISAGCGMILCYHLSRRIIKWNQKPEIAANLLTLELLRTFILVVTPLLILAAVTEAYLTPLLFALFA